MAQKISPTQVDNGGTSNSTDYLRRDGTWAAPSTGGVTDGDKGDITVSSSGAAWTIDNNAVTLAKMATIPDASLLGNNSGTGAAVPTALSVTQAKALLSLGNVNNTSDANKPISTATQTALDAKQTLDATLTALAALSWSAGTQIPVFTANDTVSFLTVGSSTGNILNKAAGDALYQPLDSDLTTIAALSSAVGNAGKVLKVGASGGWELGTDATGGGGVSDGDKGDVVVSASGATYTVESAAGDFVVNGGDLVVQGAALPNLYLKSSSSGVAAQGNISFLDSTDAEWASIYGTSTTGNNLNVYAEGQIALDGVDSVFIDASGNSANTVTLATGGNDRLEASSVAVKISTISTSQNYAYAHLASTANFANSSPTSTVLTASSTGATTIDGVTLTTSHVVLLKDQTLPAQNGLYTVTTAGTTGVATVLTRDTRFNQWLNEVSRLGLVTIGESGTANAKTVWNCTAVAGGTLGTTAINFVRMNDKSYADTLYAPIGTVGVTDGDKGDVVVSSSGTTWNLETAFKTRTLHFVIDGGGSAITTGTKGYVEVPVGCTVTAWALLADVSGSIVIDIWKDTYANYPPTVGDTITASAKPTISSATKGQSSTLTGWTTSFAAGDILAFNVDSASTVTKVTVALKVTVS